MNDDTSIEREADRRRHRRRRRGARSTGRIGREDRSDPGAPFTPEVLEALAALKKDNRAAFEALRLATEESRVPGDGAR